MMQTTNKNYLTTKKTMRGHNQSMTRNAAKEISKRTKRKKLRHNTEKHTEQKAPAEEEEDVARDEQWERSNDSKITAKMTKWRDT